MGEPSDLQATTIKEFVPGKGWTTEEPQVVQVNEPPPPVEEEATQVAGPSAAPSFRGLHSLALNDQQWRYYRELAIESARQMPPNDVRHKAIPLPYCNAYCLDAHQEARRSSFGYQSSTFQVTSREDGHLYCLRRFEDVKTVSPKIAAAVADRWKSIETNPHIALLHQCFVAQRAVFFVHEFVPGARTLQERITAPLPEAVLWSVCLQLVAALRTIHGNNLAARTLQLQHILSVMDPTASKLKVVLSAPGVVDALEFGARKHLTDLHRQDIQDLGRVLLSIATAVEITIDADRDTLTSCDSFLAQNYSRELHNLIMTIIGSPRTPSIADISSTVAQRCFEEQDSLYRAMDRTERALSAEFESGRALRLLLKLGFINERPELGPNRRWAQSGDCYVLTLFRDYVFHQADGAGFPVMDLGHVITALNKVDASDEEKIALSSRDGKTMMVVSFADIARCLDNAYHELCSSAVPPGAMLY